MKKEQYCYWCGAPAKTKEHVPPKCFFPEDYKMNGEIIRYNWSKLITVPSCEEHNNSKSQLDEYLLTRIVPFANMNNPHVVELLAGRLGRAISRNKPLLQPRRFDGENLYFDADDRKLGYSIEALARALYFHEFSCCFEGSCYIFIGSYAPSSDLYERNRSALELAKKERPQWNTCLKGAYPEIFKYQFSPTDENGCTSMIVTFYESVDVLVTFADKKHKRKRNNLGLFLEAAKMIDPFLFFNGDQGYNTLAAENEED